MFLRGVKNVTTKGGDCVKHVKKLVKLGKNQLRQKKLLHCAWKKLTRQVVYSIIPKQEGCTSARSCQFSENDWISVEKVKNDTWTAKKLFTKTSSN